jgi:hypothetical protein
MTSSHSSSNAHGVPFCALLSRAARGGLTFWSIGVAVGVLMTWLDWPSQLIESLYITAVWTAAMPFALLFAGLNDSLWEHWGWLVGTLAWLPLVIAFRFAHLFSIQNGPLRGS